VSRTGNGSLADPHSGDPHAGGRAVRGESGSERAAVKELQRPHQQVHMNIPHIYMEREREREREMRIVYRDEDCVYIYIYS
jgi:hypothetical protein